MDLPNTALFMRTLRMDNRHWQNYLLRFIMLLLIGFNLFIYFGKSIFSTQMTAPGLEFFRYISYLNLFFITVLGVTLFASAITEEKEVDSLNLLLMTGLTPFTMLISKSTSKLVIGLMLILAQLPFSILSVTLGGISMYQVLSVYITLFSYIILVCNLALFFSVICQRTYKAATLTFIVLLVFHWLSAWFPVIRGCSPFVRTARILTTGFNEAILSEQVLSNLGIGALFFFISVLIFNLFSRTSTGSGPIRISFSKKSKFRLFPVPRSWRNAIAWKEFFFTTGGTLGFFFTSLMLILFIGIEIYIAWYEDNLVNEVIGMCLIITGTVFFVLKCIYMSSTIFNREMEEKTYSTLTLLPIEIWKIAYSKIIGGSLFILPSIIAILVGIVYATNFLLDVELGYELLGVSSMILSGLVQFIFYLYLVTLCSLNVRYGGFVIALLIYFIISIALAIPGWMISVISFIPFGILGDFSGELILVINAAISIFLYAFAIIFTNRLIVKKLEKLAAA